MSATLEHITSLPALATQLGPFVAIQDNSRHKITGPHGYYEWLTGSPSPFEVHRKLLDAYERWWAEIRRPRVYFIAETIAIGAPVKIGMAGDPRSRLRTLQTSHHSPLTLYAIEYGGRAREQELHRRYEKARMNGEWFRVTAALRDYVQKLQPSLAHRLAELDARPVGRESDYGEWRATLGPGEEVEP